MHITEMSKDEKSILIYMETRLVDYGGLLDGPKMNKADLDAAKKFQEEGLLDFGRIPAALLEASKPSTHWVTFNDSAWILAHELRRVRSLRPSPARTVLDEYLAADKIAA